MNHIYPAVENWIPYNDLNNNLVQYIDLKPVDGWLMFAYLVPEKVNFREYVSKNFFLASMIYGEGEIVFLRDILAYRKGYRFRFSDGGVLELPIILSETLILISAPGPIHLVR